MGSDYYWYKIYGSILCSEVEYPQLLPTEEREADIFLKMTELERRSEDPHGDYVGEITKDSIYFCNIVGVFQILQGTTIQICPNPDSSLEDLTIFVLGYCMAMLFWQRGMEAIHCSAVEMNGEAVLISGYSGSGKSTLTTCLIDHGARLMTDDVAILQVNKNRTITVYPAFPQQKLCRDAVQRNNLELGKLTYIDEAKDKFALDRRSLFCDQPKELKGIVCLREQCESDQVYCQEITGHEKLMMVIKNLFLYPMFQNSDSFRSLDMKTCLQIAACVPVYQISRPRKIDSTEIQYEIIQKYLFGNRGEM